MNYEKNQKLYVKKNKAKLLSTIDNKIIKELNFGDEIIFIDVINFAWIRVQYEDYIGKIFRLVVSDYDLSKDTEKGFSDLIDQDRLPEEMRTSSSGRG